MRRLAFPPLIAATIAVAAWLSSPAQAQVTCPALPFTFSNGTLADATQVNAEFNAVVACANAGAAVALVHKPTNAALQATASTAFPLVWRDSVATPGDAPPQPFRSSNAPCSLNAGAGDVGAQVPSADGKCWLALFAGDRADPREWGAKFDGVTDDSAALQSAIRNGSETLGLTIVFPSGGAYVLASPVSGSGGPIRIDWNNAKAIVKETSGFAFTFNQSSINNPVSLLGQGWFTASTTAAVPGCVFVQFPAVGSNASPTLKAPSVYCLSSSATVSAPYPNSFTEGMKVSGSWYADIFVWYIGPFTGGPPISPVAGTHAIELGGNGNFGSIIKGVSIYADVPWYLSAYSEGLSFDTTDILSNKCFQANAGITPVGGLKTNGMTILGQTNCDSIRYGVDFDTGQLLYIAPTVQLHENHYDGVASWVGASLSNSVLSHLAPNIQGAAGDPGSVGVSLSGTSSHNRVEPTLSSLVTGVAIGASTAHNNGLFTYQIGTLTTLVTDASTARTNNIGPIEAGTTTMNFIGSTLAGTPTVSTNKVSYELVGRQVTVRGSVSETVAGATGGLQISPLPYPTANISNDPAECHLTYWQGIFGVDAGYLLPGLSLGPNTQAISFFEYGFNKTAVPMGVGSFDLAGGVVAKFDCTYDAW